MEGYISKAQAAEIAKDGVSKTMRQTRELIAKIANDMAADMERKGVVIDGPSALRAFAATVAPKNGESEQ